MGRRLGLLGGRRWRRLCSPTAIWPGHVAAFVNRLLLGSRHYPTRTIIEQVVINRTPVLVREHRRQRPADSKQPQGRPVTFLVQCSGELPAAGTVQLAAIGASRSRTRLELKPLSLARAADPLGSRPGAS